MINIKSREETLKEFLEKHVINRWQHEFILIDKRYKEEQETIEDSLISMFNLLCEKASELQSKDKKGTIKYIYFSYLRTSIMEDKSIYRIDAYDENWFLDQEECSINWDAQFIFSSLFLHINELEEARK